MAGFWHLSDFELLQGLAPEEMEQLERAAHVRSYDTSEVVFRPDKDPQSVYLLKEGSVRIYRLSDSGAEATFGYVRPGEIFGELSAVTALGRESHAEAAAPSVVWVVPIGLFRDLMGSKSGVAQHVSRQLGDRLKRIEKRVEGLMFHEAHLRLALILRELADHFGMQKGDGIEIDGDFTQSELATLVGCSRQTLNQCLRELETRGLVEMKRRRVALPKPDALRDFIEHETHPVA
ncbi:MAG: Crp/Fnr family transcriptional regulator [bacterium]|nr:Crp/Fnr family transcriptional regulator [bacterium]